MIEHQAVLPVGTMVHPVVRCCVQDIAKRSQVTQQLCVDQELVEEVELWVNQHLRGGDEEGQGEIKPVGQPANSF